MTYPHLAHLEQLRLNGKLVEASLYERINTAAVSRERRMRDAQPDPRPRPPTPTLDELTKRRGVAAMIYARQNMETLHVERATIEAWELGVLPPDAA